MPCSYDIMNWGWVCPVEPGREMGAGREEGGGGGGNGASITSAQLMDREFLPWSGQENDSSTGKDKRKTEKGINFVSDLNFHRF